MEIKVAIDGLSVYVNKANKKVNELTLAQIKDIYTEKIKLERSWCTDARIIILKRKCSGHNVYFKVILLKIVISVPKFKRYRA